MQDPDWWRQAAVYQIYPRSFADSNGDGIGDLKGITSRIPYLVSLGVDAVWLSPFYPSALADGGYDVDDYRDVDPKLGTLEDFDEMIAGLHAAGIKLIADIVPNHTSDRHVWFQEALAAPKGSPARERYIFRDGLGPDGATAPSDWESVFGGPTWERVPDGQWYLHLFAKEQPDLNWDNPEVREDFLTTLRFWSDRGVDGFRVDVAHALTKDMTEPLQPWAELGAQDEDNQGLHPFWDRDEVHEVFASWRAVLDEYTPPRSAVAEAWVHADRRGRYASPEGLGQAFNFDLLQASWDPASFRDIITKNLTEARSSGASSTWVFSNHDVIRHATRYGLPLEQDRDGRKWLLAGGDESVLDRELGERRARAVTQLMLALPGSGYIYQGEELGLHEVAGIPDAERQDPTFFRSPGVDVGRDGCRVPLPWTTDGESFGFGFAGAHLPQPAWFGDHAVEVQEQDPGSTLAFYRRALVLRRELQGAEDFDWVEGASGDVLHFVRPGGWHSITNFGAEPVDLPVGSVLLTSSPLEAGRLPANPTAWIR
ncbi:alpha-amylase [Arthrobacter sp. RIT-PI-e]|uniref:glycoside hydrolase family 13 protein n=1 Tax=Arthrobacter sp. RIT-PI-e TaxID=1681197 RepID=UPI00067649AC|nr:glycoside hydrolase family 13 protein [Arthrobacter sp. RIT-PI-e]KNC19791.1 alpha-amylase [Arthrobacter sp. RIT-PI-e]